MDSPRFDTSCSGIKPISAPNDWNCKQNGVGLLAPNNLMKIFEILHIQKQTECIVDMLVVNLRKRNHENLLHRKRRMTINKIKISNALIILSQFLIMGQFIIYFQTKYNLKNPLIPFERIIIDIMDLAAIKGIILTSLLIIGLIFYFYGKYLFTIIVNGLIVLVFLFYRF